MGDGEYSVWAVAAEAPDRRGSGVKLFPKDPKYLCRGY